MPATNTAFLWWLSRWTTFLGLPCAAQSISLRQQAVHCEAEMMGQGPWVPFKPSEFLTTRGWLVDVFYGGSSPPYIRDSCQCSQIKPFPADNCHQVTPALNRASTCQSSRVTVDPPDSWVWGWKGGSLSCVRLFSCELMALM